MSLRRDPTIQKRPTITSIFAVVAAILMITSVFVGTIALGGTAAAAPGDLPYRVNTGGPQYTAADGTVFEADSANSYFDGGGPYSNGQLGDGDIASTGDDTLYLTERSGKGGFDYAFPVADGTYTVKLHLAEIYFGATGGGPSGENQRVFDANIEGGTVELDDYDINADVGPQTAVVKSYDVEVTDGELNIAFSASTNQPKVSAIEVVTSEPEPNTLGGPSSVDFGTVVTGNSGTEQVSVSNLGGDGDSDITLDGASVSGSDADDFSTGFSGGVTLAPGESTAIPVSFSPSDVGAKSATLDVSHSGSNSPLSVDLSGEGASDVPVGFGKDGLSGFSAGSPTSLDFGPDGRLYVSTQGGTLYALTVQRNGPNDYEVTDQETINAIKDIPNHNDDDGSYNSGVGNRQVTGLTAAGTANNPVLYVTSSDPRIGAGGSGNDLNLDTNSGVVSKLTLQDDGSWNHVMLVRGLPRSEENHATNGIQFDASSNTLYVAQGGNTNKGAPANNFAYTPSYALSGAILSVDLDRIESMSKKNAANTGVPYRYDIPTLADTAAPFGGQDGKNMGKLVKNGPVDVFSPGYRNPYDVTLTADGQLYSVDNGPNGGWGGPPVSDGTATCTNHPNEDNSYSTGDQIQHITKGAYGGHGNPTRGNPDGAGLYDSNGNKIGSVAGAVYDGYNQPEQCNYQDPTEDNSLDYGNFEAFGASTNGLDEYTASNFGGAMQGDLLTSSFDGNIYRIQLNAAGDDLTAKPDALLSSGGTLDVVAQGDNGEFPGTVWSANHGGNSVTVFEPNDYGNAGDGGGGGQCDPSDSSGDADGDGYTNGDEQAAGTDPCSAGSVPDDNDGDGVSDVTDDDDDNDGLSDTADPFAVDADNGLSTSLPVNYDFSRNSQPDSLEGIGFTGLMTNGEDYQDLYVPGDAVFGGANPALTQEFVKPGDAHADTNTQQHAYQFGINPPDAPFVVHAPVTGFPDNPSNYQSAGIQLGTGDQDNYLKLVVSANDATGGVQFAKEVGSKFKSVAQPDDASVTGPGTLTDLYMTVYPSNNTVVASYTVDGGSATTVGKTTIPASWLSNQIDGQDVGLAVGVISTSNGASEFSVTWNDFDVTYLNQDDVPENTVPTANAGVDQSVEEGDSVTLDASGSSDADGDQLGYSWTQTASPDVSLSAQDAPQPTFTAPNVDADTTLTFEVSVSDGTASDTDTVNVTVQDTDSGTGSGKSVFAINAGGSEYTAADGTVYQADSNQFYTNSNGNYSTSEAIDGTDDDTLYQTERYGGKSGTGTFSYDIPLDNGTYNVTLQFAEIFQGVAGSDSPDGDDGNVGDRVFSANIEGGDVELSEYDIFADVGTLTATDKTYTVDVTDGVLNIDFNASADNAKISAINVVKPSDGSGDSNTAPTIDSINDQTVTEGDSASVPITTSDADGDSVSLSVNAPNFVSLSNGDLTIAPQSGDATDSPYTVEVTADDGNGGTATESFTLTVEAASGGGNGDLTVAKAVASAGDGDDTTIDQQEIQTAINWWQTDTEVPNTGGETISQQEIQNLINLWQTDATIGDGSEGGDQSSASALVEITPDSGNVAETTYNKGSYQITNTGEKNISSVSFDLSTAWFPDMVFDPQGTAGDPTGEGFNIVNEGGTGITTAETNGGDYSAFSQPHNGQNADDGYGVMTVEFNDFQNGEQATFWADNDPTSIKDANIGSQEAGPVSGLELARSTVTVTYEDGTTQTGQLMGDGSVGGSTAVLNGSEAPAPTLDVEGVSLDSNALRDYHSAATVSEASQTVTVTGQPGETVTLVHAEGELTLTNVPDADNNGEPGYDLESYEANSAQTVNYHTVTLNDNGEATVPITLLNVTDDGNADGGYNYFVAAQGEASGDMGLASNVVVLKLHESTGDGGDTGQPGNVAFAVNAGGSEYTATDGTVYQADTNFDGGSTSEISQWTGSSDTEIGNTDDDPLYRTERYGGKPGSAPFSYDVPVENGTYEVTLQFAEIYQGVADSDSPGGGDGTNAGDRVFSANIEGGDVELSEYDIFADVGSLNATDKTYTVDVADGELNIEFSASTDNAKISAIKVTKTGDGSGNDSNTAPSIQSISDQTVTESDSTTVPVSATDAEGDSLSLSKTSGPAFVTLTDDGDGTGTFDIAPQSGDAGSYTVEVTADDGIDQTKETFTVTVEEPSSGSIGSADFAVNENAGTDASTYSGGSIRITNTGDKQISSVTYDLSSSVFPDVVFDPDGSAGDSTAKDFTPDSGASAVSPRGSFAAPHNGQDGSDGYDKLTVDFDDFESDESFAFSTDIDPTSIKNAQGSGAAGSVSGLELSGATVTVEYADGSTQTTSLFGDGSDGGSQATAKATVASAPTLGAAGVSLDSNALDAQHSAATVANADQTVTVSGPAGATVRLLHIEGQIELANQAQGYNLEAFEANTAEKINDRTVQLDSNGEATVAVTLTNTSRNGAEGGFNYFIAAVQDGDGDTGTTSNVVVLKYDESSGGSSSSSVLHRVNVGEGTTVSATDGGPDWSGVAGTGSQYLASADSNGDNYCKGDDVTPDSTVPSSTPNAVFDCERYGNSTWEFSVDSGQDVEVRLYFANSFSGANEPGDRQFNVSIEGNQVLTQYDPVADVGHATGAIKSFTATDDGDGTITIAFEKGAVEKPEVRAIEIVNSGGSSQ